MIVDGLPFLPTWFEGETLYSWAARFHMLRGRPASRDTGIFLFGKCATSTRYGFPLGVGQFVAITRGRLGTVSEIVVKRTILGELRPFTSATCWDALLNAFLDAESSTGVGRDNLSRFSGPRKMYPSRYCPDCVKHELKELGTSYWHLQSQLQCSVVCLRHQRPLDSAIRGPRSWVLPHQCNPSQMQSVSDRTFSVAALLSRLSEICSSLNHIDQVTFAQAASRRLLAQDVKTIDPRQCGESIQRWFSNTHASLVAQAFIPDCPKVAEGKWIVELLRARNSSKPIYWLLLWTALLEDLPERSALEEFRSASAAQMVDVSPEREWDELSRNMLYRFLYVRRVRPKSRNDVSLNVGLSPVTV